MFERLTYQSTPAMEFGSLALFHLLTQAQIRNERLQITGHLLYWEGQFTQCIEGPSESIDQLWESLQRDARHQQIELLARHPIEVRRFGKWSMAFSTYSALYVHGMRGFFPVKEGDPSPLIPHCTSSD